MLVNLSDLMRIAEERQIAIGAFNGPTLESARAALEAAQELGITVEACRKRFHRAKEKMRKNIQV